jgi:regulator of protease activity HflC (stomatin/prohibitin superfamily)
MMSGVWRNLGTLAAITFLPGAISSTLYTVDGGERAIIYDMFRGISNDVVKGEGTHIKIPIIETPIIFDVRIKATHTPTTTGTKGTCENII